MKFVRMVSYSLQAAVLGHATGDGENTGYLSLAGAIDINTQNGGAEIS